MGFFLVSAEISALRVEKQHLLKKIFLPIFSMHLGEYCLKVSNFFPSYKKSYLNVTNRGEMVARIEHDLCTRYYISLIYIYESPQPPSGRLLRVSVTFVLHSFIIIISLSSISHEHRKHCEEN